VLTSNRSRELSEALKRRCLHLQLDYPTPEVELEIVRLKAPGIREALAAELVGTIQRLRGVDLRKAPSIGETLDWAQALIVLGADALDKELIEETLSVIVKYDRDAEKARQALELNGGAHAHDDEHDHAHGHHHHHH
jgi:MoxR-like ATPase